MRGRRGLVTMIGTIAVTALAPGSARAADADLLALQRGDVPAFAPARASVPAARRACTTTRPHLAPVRVEAKAYAQGKGTAANRLVVQACRVGSGHQATRVLAGVRKLARRDGAKLTTLHVGDAALVAVTRAHGKGAVLTEADAAVRVAGAVAVLRLRTRLPAAAARATVTALLRAQAARLRRALARTTYDRVAAGIRPDGSRSTRTSLQFVALLYAHRIPGAALPAGPLTGPPVSGTTALTDALGRWRSLTGAQRSALLAAAVARPRRTRAAQTRAVDPVSGCQTKVGAKSLNPGESATALTLRNAIAAQEGYAATFKVCVYDASGGGTTLADTNWWMSDSTAEPYDSGGIVAVDDPADLDMCYIREFDGYRTLDATNRRTVLAHETYHCTHTEWRARHGSSFPFPSVPDANPQWIEDGMATWAGDQVAKGTFQPADKAPGLYLARWLTDVKPFFTQTYQFFGGLGELERVSGPAAIWSRAQSVWAGGQNSAAIFATVTGSNGFDFLEQVGAAAFREPSYPPGWNQDLPYAVSQGELATVKTFLIPPAGPTSASVGPYNFGSFEIVGYGNPVLQVTLAGHGRLSDGKTAWNRPSGMWFCYDSTCACPAGQHEKKPFPPMTKVTDLYAGLGADASPSTLTLDAHPVSEYCEDDGTPKLPPGNPGGPPGNGGGGSNGDPHLVTFDGLRYDFQAAGEYLLARGPGRSFEIQARQEPLPRSSYASINTQIALRVGTARVTVHPGDTPRVRVAGKEIDASKPTALPGGGSVGPAGRFDSCSGVVVRWADGSWACVRSVGSYGLAVNAVPAKRLEGKVTGLLGNANGAPADDLATRAGKTLGVQSTRNSYSGLYHAFGDTWRLTQAESLLDYGPGETTATFRKSKFPRRFWTPADLSASARRRAEAICRAAGVTDPDVLEDCILDVALSGDDAFATSAAEQEDVGATTPWQAVAGLEDMVWSGLAVAATGGTSSLAALVSPSRNTTNPGHDVVTGFDAADRQGPVESLAPSVTSATPPALAVDPGGTLQLLREVDGWSPAPPAGVTSRVVGWLRGPAGWSPSDWLASASFADPSAVAYTADATPWTLLAAYGGGSFTVRRGRGPNDTPPSPPVGAGCAATDGNLAADGAAVWAMYLQWDCADDATSYGYWTAPLDPATGAFGPPSPVPLPAGGKKPLYELLGSPARLVTRPGGGVWTAYTADVGGARHLYLFRLGGQGAVDLGTVPSTYSEPVLAASPSGRLWVGWFDRTPGGKTLLRLRRTGPSDTTFVPGVQTLVVPQDAAGHLPFFTSLRSVANGEALDLAMFISGSADAPASVWHVRVTF